MRSISSFNSGWTFHNGFDDELPANYKSGQQVELPHNAVELPFNYFDESEYQRPFCYQKSLAWDPGFQDRQVSLIFDGAMADSVVFLNGEAIASHRDGFTPFEVQLTPKLSTGENLITVKIDGTENPGIPPFGGQIDYLTYAGIYRDVWLKVVDEVSIEGIKVETRNVLSEMKSAAIYCELRDSDKLVGDARIAARLFNVEGREIACVETMSRSAGTWLELRDLPTIDLWEPDDPVLYKVVVELEYPGGTDSVSTWAGFRTAEFAPNGFCLNGRLLKIRGLNRHQSYPYVGYAMGRRAQERDAEILKFDLKCNLVRTSHYPQSNWFLDHCDRIGLLVFEEIPGWQHIGGPKWKRESVENIRRMIRRDWNHPSIILWGVRINESKDDKEFYEETNAVARKLDPTRQTAGVRNFAHSELLEDVYTMNDFVLGNEELPWVNHFRIPLRKQKDVTGLESAVPYMVTEFNGHMYPTKLFDSEQRHAEHATRHLQILDAMYGDPQISGCIGWCMSDYNTHKDFGSGDRICHHGVLDMFRVPKFAAYAYASQCDPSEAVVLKPVTFGSRGERSIGGVFPLILLTNCDEVELQFGRELVVRAKPDRDNYRNLPRPPVVIDHRHIPIEVIGNWRTRWEDLVLTGYVDGVPKKEVRLVCDPWPCKLEVSADSPFLLATEKDAVRVVARALDHGGSAMPVFNDPLNIEVEGPANIIGPAQLSFKGGVAAFWLESVGETGRVEAKLSSQRFAPAILQLDAVRGDPFSMDIAWAKFVSERR
ncbi:MAG: glycoside hydrolase family 2 protein [Albidovulum sp.]|nr:glycoside hydrolase family 2 protein [Albidovulum sp.]